MNESSSIIIQRGKYAIIEYRATEIGPPASDTNVKCHEALVKAGWKKKKKKKKSWLDPLPSASCLPSVHMAALDELLH